MHRAQELAAQGIFCLEFDGLDVEDLKACEAAPKVTSGCNSTSFEVLGCTVQILFRLWPSCGSHLFLRLD